MDIQIILGLIETLGVPVFVTGACMWYIYKKDLMHQTEIDSWRNKDDTSDERLVSVITLTNSRNEEFSLALNDQTSAIKELVAEMRRNK
tara:strand:+ start:104 stop:370 length:267 start_codon:yes stop_codon:yes gene_type:complete